VPLSRYPATAVSFAKRIKFKQPKLISERISYSFFYSFFTLHKTCNKQQQAWRARQEG
jgi:hypothetical protein